MHGIPGLEMERTVRFRQFFIALRRGFALGRCRGCETFFLMARLCRDESGDALGSEERADCESWVEAGTLVEADFGCEGACAIIPLYSRIAR